MELGIGSLSGSLLFYTESRILERFGKFCQIKANYAKDWMLDWEYKRPARKYSAAFNRSKEENEVNRKPLITVLSLATIRTSIVPGPIQNMNMK